ncbi:DUF4349 domain-containing protein [candidate division WOR-3 bacterium]|uniref:DUF4349 domain-containing protein n=1 Tax=candidate division WOR-3 bacterium TaxID=2052148 RepID=A0A9D5KCT9_UNCW3|nr:DUF4349 domain-containing protein [candidate division WOR-3 bacterium]MBD3365271.1 DUF4349 domain-containing protein [candidate division WOR-3 bacterium]
MKRWLALVLMVGVVLSISAGSLGCAKRAEEAEESMEMEAVLDESLPPKAMESQSKARSGEATSLEKDDAPGNIGGTTSEVEPPETRMVIKTASLSMRVEDVDAAYSRAVQLTEQHDGYVHSGTFSESEGTRVDMTLKVHPHEFTRLMTNLEGLGDVDYKNISGEDVTEEYYDLQSELKKWMASRERFYDLLKRSGSIEDILMVEVEIERVEGNINRIKGRMKYLEAMVGESTINLTLYSQKPSTFVDWNEIGQGFKRAAQILVYAFFGILQALVVLIPIGLIVLLIVFIIIWIVRKSKKKKKA